MTRETGRKIIDAEMRGLAAVRDGLGAAFEEAVDAILKAERHVIVTGVGKSGHIGAKIASTLASTGTPSFFMHPGEASHGDLGMVTSGSVIIAISRSGESRELRDVLIYADKISLRVIGITQNDNSTLARLSSTVLILPSMPEADPNNLAPSVSTTATLALGDALALTVMHERGFSKEEFGARHPGGALGLQSLKVSDWLVRHPDSAPLVQVDADLKTVISEIASGQMGCVGVYGAEGTYVGIITDGDLRRALDGDVYTKRAVDIMTPAENSTSLTRDMRLADVVALMREKRISNGFVLEDGKPIGAIHMKDLLAEGYV